MENKFEFGDKVKHIVLGIEGIVMAYTFYSTGCIHYGVQRIEFDEDGDPKDWLWYDENRLKLVKAGEVKFDSYISEGKRTSGPAPCAPRG